MITVFHIGLPCCTIRNFCEMQRVICLPSEILYHVLGLYDVKTVGLILHVKHIIMSYS